MSYFSEKCKEILSDHGYSVYQFSADHALDKTTVQRMITGKRLPSIEFVAGFCDALKLNPNEREELLHLFNIEKYGIATVNQRLLIQQIFEETHYFESIDHTHNAPLITSGFPSAFEDSISYDCNPINVNNKIIQVLGHEYSSEDKPFFYSNIPAIYTDFFTSITQLTTFYAPKKLDFCHLLSFHKNSPSPEAIDHNLSILKIVLPFMQNKQLNYRPYYNYTNTILDKTQPFPFYVITHKQVLWLSSDFKKTYCVSDHTCSDFILDTVKNNIKHNFSLFYEPATPFKSINYYIDSIKKYGAPSHILKYSPCFSLMQPQDIDINSLLLPELMHHPEYKEPASRILNTIVNVPLNYKVYCMDTGASDFFKSGEITGAHSLIIKPFPKEMRKPMIKSFYENACQSSNIHIINSANFTFPKDLHIDIFSNRLVVIYTFKSIEDFAYIEIKDPIICNALFDFAQSLEYSTMTMTHENMLKFLENIIEHT